MLLLLTVFNPTNVHAFLFCVQLEPNNHIMSGISEYSEALKKEQAQAKKLPLELLLLERGQAYGVTAG